MLTLIITGAPSAVYVPGILSLICSASKEKREISVIMTESAANWVTELSLASSGATKIITNFSLENHHIGIAEQSKYIFVYPATFNYINQLSLGITCSIALMVASLAINKVTLYPSIPANLINYSIYEENKKRLMDLGAIFSDLEEGLEDYRKVNVKNACPSPQRLLDDIIEKIKDDKNV